MFGERTSMNAPIQGTAADVIKIAMINVYNRLQKEQLSSKMIAQVHDELIIDVVKEEQAIVEKLLKEEMENAVSLKVKLFVEVESGTTWDLK
jgi:DNA polymerase-1